MPHSGMRLGDYLGEAGDLTDQQIETILQEQGRGNRPFGELAERMYGVSHEAIQRAWVKQYMGLGTLVDLDTESLDPDLLGLFTRRQAWQMRLLPLRRENGGVVIATCAERLSRAVTFAWQHVNAPVYVVIATREQLLRHLMSAWPPRLWHRQ